MSSECYNRDELGTAAVTVSMASYADAEAQSSRSCLRKTEVTLGLGLFYNQRKDDNRIGIVSGPIFGVSVSDRIGYSHIGKIDIWCSTVNAATIASALDSFYDFGAI